MLLKGIQQAGVWDPTGHFHVTGATAGPSADAGQGLRLAPYSHRLGLVYAKEDLRLQLPEAGAGAAVDDLR